MSRLVEIAKTASAVTTAAAVPLVLTSYLFGFEPQILSCICPSTPPREVPTFNEYLHASQQINGNSFGTDALTSVAYPGAVAGIYFSNYFLVGQK